MLLRAQSTLVAHYGVVYDTPRGVTPAFVLVLCSIVEVLNDQKKSVSNAFLYVVLHPLFSLAGIAIYGIDAGAKIQSFSKRKEKRSVFCKHSFYAFFQMNLFPDNLCTPVLTLEVAFAERFGFWVVIRQIAEKARWNGAFLKITATFLPQIVFATSIFRNAQERECRNGRC